VKNSDQKKVFSFFVLSFFSYRINTKNQKNIVTKKGDKKFLLFFLSIIFLSLFYGEKTKPQAITKSRKGSQTGAGQGREERAISLPLCW
jgi:preprotein translocase subunit SecG